MKPISKAQIIFTILAVVALAWFLATRPKVAPTVVTPTPVVTTNPDTTTWPSFEVKKETISDSNQYYSIDVAYPATKDIRISDHLKSFAEDQIAQFKDDTSWAMDPKVSSAADSSLSLDISYQETRSAHADTYVFNIVTYTGGAHGLQVTKTFAFDIHGKALSVSDLFTNGEEGLKTVSTFVQKELTKKAISDAAWIADGAGPKAENYQSFIIGDEGITFVFDPYNVAPYSAGTQNILVPLTVFKGIANSELFGK